MKHIKAFSGWVDLKEALHNKAHQPPFVSEGEIWWASLGANVGSEIDGKSKLFSRPVIILKKLAHGFYFAIPTTTQKRHGDWHVPFNQNGKEVFACLQQARSIDYKRLWNRLGQLDSHDFKAVKKGFKNLYK